MAAQFAGSVGNEGRETRVRAFQERFPSDGAPVEERRSETFERVLLWLFIAGLAWCPFWLGSNRELAWGVNGVLFPGLAIVYEAYLLVTRKPHPVGIRNVALSAVLFLVVVAWIVVQLATWTPAVLHNPAWSLTADVLGKPVPGSITVDRDLTTLSLLRLITAAAVFWLALQLGRDPGRASLLIHAIGLIGVVYAAYGLFALVAAPGTVLWLDNPRMQGRLTSTFVNRNSYATYAGLGLVVMSGLIFQVFRDRVVSTGVPFKYKLIRFVEVAGHRSAFLLGGAAIILAALLATVSRGGILATACGLLALAVMVAAQNQKQSKSGALRVMGTLAAFFLVFVGGFFVFGSAFTDRLAGDGLVDAGRMNVYSITFRSILDAPLLGFGYGTFADVFPMIRDRSIHIQAIWDKAHNTYLDIYQGLGVIAGTVLVLSVVLLVLKCITGAGMRRQNAIVPTIATAAALIVGTHAIVDFSLEIQAVTLTFMAILGAGVAQSQSSRVGLGDA